MKKWNKTKTVERLSFAVLWIEKFPCYFQCGYDAFICRIIAKFYSGKSMLKYAYHSALLRFFFLHLLSIFLHFFQYSIMFISNCNEIFLFVLFCLVCFQHTINTLCLWVCVCFFRTKRCIPRKVDSLAPQKESLPSSSRLRQIWLDSLSFIINIK